MGSVIEYWRILFFRWAIRVVLGFKWRGKKGEDRVLPFEDYGRPLIEVLGLKSHQTLPGCGHNPNWDDPQGVAAAILDFMRAVEAGFRGDAA